MPRSLQFGRMWNYSASLPDPKLAMPPFHIECQLCNFSATIPEHKQELFARKYLQGGHVSCPNCHKAIALSQSQLSLLHHAVNPTVVQTEQGLSESDEKLVSNAFKFARQLHFIASFVFVVVAIGFTAGVIQTSAPFDNINRLITSGVVGLIGGVCLGFLNAMLLKGFAYLIQVCCIIADT